MLEDWKDLCSTPRGVKAIEWLENPWELPGMRALTRHWQKPCVQLFVLHEHHPYCSWSVLEEPEAKRHSLIRRVRWDWIHDNLLRDHIRREDEPTIYGSDALVPSEEFEQFLMKLDAIRIPAFAFSPIFGTHGVTFGVKKTVGGRKAELHWWGPPPPGWQELAAWHTGCVEWLESQLPAHTDRLGHGAERPWSGDAERMKP